MQKTPIKTSAIISLNLIPGITSLIREGLAAWDSHELGRLVFKYGGQPVGAFAACPNQRQQLAGDVAHALFLDWTHDNPSPAEKRTIRDMLPSAGKTLKKNWYVLNQLS